MFRRILEAAKWIVCGFFPRGFFPLTIAILIVFYMRWFRLTPWVLLDEPTIAFTAGMFLLTLYGFMVKVWLTNQDLAVKILLFSVCLLLLGANGQYLRIHIPQLRATAVCSGTRYFISQYVPFLDEQWNFYQLSKWRGVFYESHFFGLTGGTSYRIVCDTEKKEVDFVNNYSDLERLRFTDGEHPRSFDQTAMAKLKGHLYFLSISTSIPETCGEGIYNCYLDTYTLYQCSLDYTACEPLPIHYTTDDSRGFRELKADRKSGEIHLFVEPMDSDVKILIFTYGENPRCYAEGCSIDP